MRKGSFHICEYGLIHSLEDYLGLNPQNTSDELYLKKEHFESIYQYCLESQGESLDANKPFNLFSRGGKKHIRIKNYVGLIETKDGLHLEILPKIYLEKTEDNVIKTRTIFLNMLRHLKDSPFINIDKAHINTKQNFPILEVFIRSYIFEIERIFKHGVKSDYVLNEENLNSLRGKLKVNQNIKFNHHDKSKLYCEFLDYSQNIPKNKIIKATLLKLLKHTKNYQNYYSINKLLYHLHEIEASVNHKEEFRKIDLNNRLYANYRMAINWSEVFLLGRGFTNFHGKNLNIAILFPMERLFEDYVAYLFEKYLIGHKIKAQDQTYFLVDRHKNAGKFLLKPDLVATNSENQRIVIIDTKWKLIDASAEKKNYNISQADMYQLYAYGKKYSKDNIEPKLVLLYPSNQNFLDGLDNFIYEGDLELQVLPFDFNAREEEQIEAILSLTKEPV